MTASVLRSGTQIAPDVRDSSANSTLETQALKTLADLLAALAKDPPRAFPMLRTTSALLVAYLNDPPEKILVDSVNEAREGFRPYLEGRKYAENSVRTYVNHVRILLNCAREFGWLPPNQVIPEEWQSVLALSTEKQCEDLVRHLVGLRKTPRDVTIEDVDRWAQMRVQQGLSNGRATNKKAWFWRLLRDCRCTEQIPTCIVREKHYRVPLDQFPSNLKREVLGLLRWKTVEFAVGRPKGGRHRDVTSKQLKDVICGLFGYVVNIRDESGISSLPQLVEKQILSAYLEWSINERRVKGYPLQCALRLLSAAMRQHPTYSSLDLSWFKPMLDSLPTEPESELKKRRAARCLDYQVVESIPAKLRAERPAAAKKGIYRVALLVKEELLMKWLTALPWRQRNIRECRINGPAPNLFKGKIPPFSDIDKPDWVQQEEKKSPDAEFWQFHFTPNETKTEVDVHALLPRPLIGILEEYLGDYRPRLLRGPDPGTLFLNQEGKAITAAQLVLVVSTLTQRHGGRRVTPHSYRHIFAFAWLKEHPKDYLTLSKILWHSNVSTTIRIYGSSFNESSGVCSTESWLEERAAYPK